ncbi:MAG TPA: helix-turn-helix transcriptional regulator [Clostridia bacterium]
MSLGERVKLIRKALMLTQKEFAEKIGLKQAAIGLYENGNRNVTDRVISDICREFNVNEEWIRSGNGEMFKKEEKLKPEYLEDDLYYNAIKKAKASGISVDEIYAAIELLEKVKQRPGHKETPRSDI